MVNSFVYTALGAGGEERDLSIIALHNNPNGYGLEYACDYKVILPGIEDDEEDQVFGYFHFSADKKHWAYEGVNLSIPDQEEIADIIQTYEEGDVIL